MKKDVFRISIRSYQDYLNVTRMLDHMRNAVFSGEEANPLPLPREKASSLFNIAAGLLRNVRHAYPKETDIVAAEVAIAWNPKKNRGSVCVRQPISPGSKPVDLNEVRRTRPDKYLDSDHSGTGLIFELEHPTGYRRRMLRSLGLAPSDISITDRKGGTERIAKVGIRQIQKSK